MTSIPPRLPTSCVFGEVARNFTLEELAVHHRGVRARVHFPSILTSVAIRSRLGLDAQRRGERGDVRRKVRFEEEWDATGQYQRNLLDNDGLLYMERGSTGEREYRRAARSHRLEERLRTRPGNCYFDG